MMLSDFRGVDASNLESDFYVLILSIEKMYWFNDIIV